MFCKQVDEQFNNPRGKMLNTSIYLGSNAIPAPLQQCIFIFCAPHAVQHIMESMRRTHLLNMVI